MTLAALIPISMTAPIVAAGTTVPWSDWQFWLVTALALVAAAAIVRPMLPSREKKAGCPGCGPSSPPRKTELTVDGQRVR